MPNIETLINNETHYPFFIELNPWTPGQEETITVELAMIFMRKTVGEFNPEKMLLKYERHRKKYLVALPKPLITILIDHTKTPQKFPKSETRDPNLTWQAVPHTAAPARYWFAIAKPGGSPTPSPNVLRQVLEDALAGKGITITQLTPTLTKTKDSMIKHLTGIYHVELEIKDRPPEAPVVTLTELKGIKIIDDKLWEVKMAHTVTHKLKLCTHCWGQIPRLDPATRAMPAFFDFVEQQEGETAKEASTRLQLYIATAICPACKIDHDLIRKRGPSSSSDQVEQRSDRFKDLLAKRAKETPEDAEAF